MQPVGSHFFKVDEAGWATVGKYSEAPGAHGCKVQGFTSQANLSLG